MQTLAWFLRVDVMLLHADAQHACQARSLQEYNSPHRSPQTESPCRPNLRDPKRNFCTFWDTRSAATSPSCGPYANPETSSGAPRLAAQPLLLALSLSKGLRASPL